MYLSHFALDDFARPPTSSYLKSRKDTNILNFICQDLLPKIEIAKLIVSAVKKRDKFFFPTHSHVKWTMECIGFAFSLPIEHSNTIGLAIEVYRNWLGLGNEDRPDCIEKEEEVYRREIIGHLSLLFIERPGDVHKHAELCKEVLILIKDLCRQKVLENETWEHLLKLLLMVTCGLLKNNTLLMKEIAPLLLKTLFEMWFRSNTRETELWEDLNKNISQWVSHIWVIYHWRSLQEALTQSVINIIYGQDTAKLKIHFKQLQKPFEIEAEIVVISVTKEQVLYFWYQFLQLISRNTISKIPIESENCTELVKAFASITDQFLEFSKSRNAKSKVDFEYFGSDENSNLDDLLGLCKKIHEGFIEGELIVPMPKVNSILSIFGNWLFSYANCDYLYCEHGRAKAIGVLCRVFSSNLGPVNEEYAGKFYKTISYIMKGGVNSIVIKNIVKYSTSLLCRDIPGVRLLVDKDYLLKAIYAQFNDKRSDQKLRRYCYEIISSFVGCLQYFKKVEAIQSLHDLLLDAVQNENDPENFSKLIWIVASFIATMRANELIQNIVTAITNRLKNIIIDKLYLDLLCMLSTVPFLIFDKSASSLPIVLRVLNKLCSYLKKKYQLANKNIPMALIFCIRKWIVCFPNCLSDSKTRFTILEVLACTKLSDKLIEISLFMEEFITCNIGKNRETIQLTLMSELVMPVGLMNRQRQELKNYMIDGKILFSLYGDDDEMIGVFRNSIGRSVWKAAVKYTKMEVKEKIEWEMDVIHPDKSIFELEDVEINADLDEDEEEMLNRLKLLKARQETKAVTQKKYGFVRSGISIRSGSNSSPRQFLAHLGLFDYEQLRSITQINSDIVNPNIASLDSFSEKEAFFMPIFYLNTSISLEFLSASEYYSLEFQYFCQQLGVLLDSKHANLAFLSHLQLSIEKYKSLLYISDGLHEVLSIVSGLSNAFSLQEIVGASPVVVIWNERTDDKFCVLQPSLLHCPELEHKVCILITPLRNKLIRVNFYPSTEQPGPLSENMVLPLEIIGKLLIYTLINIYGDSTESITSRKNREDLLEQLDMLGKNEDSFETRLDSLLSYSFNLPIKH